MREKGRDLPQSYDKSSYTPQKNKKQRDNTKNATNNVDYTTIWDRFSLAHVNVYRKLDINNL